MYRLCDFVSCSPLIIDDLCCIAQGVTVYRALKYSETSPGDWVVIPGAGGGLGHLGA